MERITGTDAANLMEAYAQVYAPQEITEEQVWEEVENWVNSLVEEGYDLSEYTWEDMYEEYLKEYTRQADRPGQTPAEVRAAEKAARERGAATARAYQEKSAAYKPPGILGGIGDLLNRLPRGQGRMDSELGRPEKPQKPTPAPQQNLRGLTIGPGGFNINGRPVPTTPAAPAQQRSTAPVITAPRPAATAPAPRPAATAPAPRPAATPAATPATAKPAPTAAAPAKTANPLLKDNSISDMIKASQMRQKGVNVTSDNIASVRQSVQQANRPEVLNRPAPAGTALARQQQGQGTTVSGSGALGSAANPQVRAQLGLKPINPTSADQKKKVTVAAGVDLFDIVKGHLMSEGYADTEEAALQIMANMSEEWKQSIVEAVTGGGAPNVPPAVAKFVDELPSRIQTLFGKPTSTAKPTPKRK